MKRENTWSVGGDAGGEKEMKKDLGEEHKVKTVKED